MPDTEEMLCLLIISSLLMMMMCSVFSEPSSTWQKFFHFFYSGMKIQLNINSWVIAFCASRLFISVALISNIFPPRALRREAIKIFWNYLNGEQLRTNKEWDRGNLKMIWNYLNGEHLRTNKERVGQGKLKNEKKKKNNKKSESLEDLGGTKF